MTTWLRITQCAFLLASMACGAYWASISVHANALQNAATRESGSSSVVDPPPTGRTYVMGRLTIPALKLAVPILSNYETESLHSGIGHIPGTAMPGGLGTMGLAGHRDTYFRPLKNIKPQMDIQVADKSGTYHYSVDSTEIVQPEDVQVLDIQSRPELTLITCYPFNYIGAAPKRFIVHAHLLSALPDPI